MIYSDSVKKHWLDKIEEHKDNFNPDCGNRRSKWNPEMGAPQHVLTNTFESQDWSFFEKEFQLPRWILNIMIDYYHDFKPSESYEIIKQLFTAIPTYTDLEPIRHKFSLRLLYRLQAECGLQYSRMWNQTLTDSPIRLGEVIGTAIVEHQLALADPKYKVNMVKIKESLSRINMDIMVYMNDADGSGCQMIEHISDGSFYSLAEFYIKARDNVGKPLPNYDEDGAENNMDNIWNDLIDTLEEYKEVL